MWRMSLCAMAAGSRSCRKFLRSGTNHCAIRADERNWNFELARDGQRVVVAPSGGQQNLNTAQVGRLQRCKISGVIWKCGSSNVPSISMATGESGSSLSLDCSLIFRNAFFLGKTCNIQPGLASQNVCPRLMTL